MYKIIIIIIKILQIVTQNRTQTRVVRLGSTKYKVHAYLSVIEYILLHSNIIIQT